jgi:hypothetical protein
MNMVTENKASQFDFREYIIRILIAVHLSQVIFGALLFNPCEGLTQIPFVLYFTQFVSVALLVLLFNPCAGLTSFLWCSIIILIV